MHRTNIISILQVKNLRPRDSQGFRQCHLVVNSELTHSNCCVSVIWATQNYYHCLVTIRRYDKLCVSLGDGTGEGQTCRTSSQVPVTGSGWMFQLNFLAGGGVWGGLTGTHFSTCFQEGCSDILSWHWVWALFPKSNSIPLESIWCLKWNRGSVFSREVTKLPPLQHF